MFNATETLTLVEIAYPSALLALVLCALFIPRPFAGGSSSTNEDGPTDGSNGQTASSPIIPITTLHLTPRYNLIFHFYNYVVLSHLLALLLPAFLPSTSPFETWSRPALFAGGACVVSWVGSGWNVHVSGKKGKAISHWVKAAVVTGILGNVAIGILAVWIFVNQTTRSEPPQSINPLSFILHLVLISARLILLILILWAIYSPTRDFRPAQRHSTDATGGEGEDRRPLLDGERASQQERASEGEGYGTFDRGGEVEANKLSTSNDGPEPTSPSHYPIKQSYLQDPDPDPVPASSPPLSPNPRDQLDERNVPDQDLIIERAPPSPIDPSPTSGSTAFMIGADHEQQDEAEEREKGKGKETKTADRFDIAVEEEAGDEAEEEDKSISEGSSATVKPQPKEEASNPATIESSAPTPAETPNVEPAPITNPVPPSVPAPVPAPSVPPVSTSRAAESQPDQYPFPTLPSTSSTTSPTTKTTSLPPPPTSYAAAVAPRPTSTPTPAQPQPIQPRPHLLSTSSSSSSISASASSSPKPRVKTLSDVGRRLSEESKGLVRRLSKKGGDKEKSPASTVKDDSTFGGRRSTDGGVRGLASPATSARLLEEEEASQQQVSSPPAAQVGSPSFARKISLLGRKSQDRERERVAPAASPSGDPASSSGPSVAALQEGGIGGGGEGSGSGNASPQSGQVAEGGAAGGAGAGATGSQKRKKNKKKKSKAGKK